MTSWLHAWAPNSRDAEVISKQPGSLDTVGAKCDGLVRSICHLVSEFVIRFGSYFGGIKHCSKYTTRSFEGVQAAHFFRPFGSARNSLGKTLQLLLPQGGRVGEGPRGLRRHPRLANGQRKRPQEQEGLTERDSSEVASSNVFHYHHLRKWSNLTFAYFSIGCGNMWKPPTATSGISVDFFAIAPPVWYHRFFARTKIDGRQVGGFGW